MPWNKYKMSVMCCVCLLCLNLVALTYTTQIKSLLEISELQNNRTFIRNDQEVLKKLNKLIQEGRDHLQIITDFDLTLTADPGESSKTVLNSFEMLRLCPSIPQSYRDEDIRLYKKYKPIEEDPSLSITEKSKYMVEWLQASLMFLRGVKFPRQELEEIARNTSNSFRDGVHVLLEWTKANDVPVVVLSSGLGDGIVASLRAANLFTQNVKVISNFLGLDKDDKITGWKGDLIHSYNKNEALIKNTDYYKTLRDRTNFILLGDSIGDANMTAGIDNCNTVIKIGFLSKKKRNHLQTYLSNFDIVLENDQTMDIINAVINRL